MRKYFMSVAALAGMMTLAACSSDDVVVNNDNDVQTIQIAVASTGDRATRSRDLNSEEPGQNIETVKVVIRNKNTHEVVYVGTIDNWNSNDNSELPNPFYCCAVRLEPPSCTAQLFLFWDSRKTERG